MKVSILFLVAQLITIKVNAYGRRLIAWRNRQQNEFKNHFENESRPLDSFFCAYSQCIFRVFMTFFKGEHLPLRRPNC